MRANEKGYNDISPNGENTMTDMGVLQTSAAYNQLHIGEVSAKKR